MNLPSTTHPQRLGRKTSFFLVCYAALRAGPLRGGRMQLVQRTQRALALEPGTARAVLEHAREAAARRSGVPRPFSASRLMAHACRIARRSGALDARQELLLVRLGAVLGVSEERVREGLERSSGSLEVPVPPPPPPPEPEHVGSFRTWLAAGVLAMVVATLAGLGLVQARIERDFTLGKALAEATTEVCLASLKDAERGHHAEGLARIDAELGRLEAHPQRHRLDFLLAQAYYCRGRILHSEVFHRQGKVDRDEAIEEAYAEALRLIEPLGDQAPDTFEVIVSGIADFRRDTGDTAEASRLRGLLGREFEPRSPGP